MQQQNAALVLDADGNELGNPGQRNVDRIGQVRGSELCRHANVNQQRAVAQVICSVLNWDAIRVAEEQRESEKIKDDKKDCPFHVLYIKAIEAVLSGRESESISP